MNRFYFVTNSIYANIIKLSHRLCTIDRYMYDVKLVSLNRANNRTVEKFYLVYGG